jgi:hypothetical protein
MLYRISYFKKYYREYWPSVFSYALKNPKNILSYFIRTGSKKWIKNFFDNYNEYENIASEIECSNFLQCLDESLARKFLNLSGKTVRGNNYIPGAIKKCHAINMYALVRKHTPEVLVETGVCNGYSTAVLLLALQRNGAGHLYSIDYPEFADDHIHRGSFWHGKGGAVVPPGEESGWLVPMELRDRWTLTLGKSKHELQPLLHELGQIDFFLHDSEHSFENQLFEFSIVFKFLQASGILLASDITWSNAFDVFWKVVKKKARRYFIDHNLAIVSKSR